MPQGPGESEDRGLSVWVVVGVGAAALLLIVAAVVLAATSRMDATAEHTTTTTLDVSTTRLTTSTTLAPTTTTLPVSTTLGGIEDDFNREPEGFLLRNGTPVAELSSFIAVVELSVTVGDFQLMQESTGTWVGDAYDCITNTSFAGLETEVHVVGTDDRIWIERGAIMAPTYEWNPDVQTALSACPSYPGFWAQFEAPEGLTSGETGEINGIPVRVVDTGGLTDLILANEADAVDVEESNLYLADPGGWVVGMDVALSIDGDAAADSLGLPGGDTSQTASIDMSLRISNVDDPELVVSLPPPSFPFFRGDEELATVGEARIVDDEFLLRLTKSTNAVVAGAVWLERKQHVADGFDTHFVFRMTDIGPNPGDGLAFVVQNSASDAMGAGASAIGYGDIPNSLAIEFDTVFHDYESDPLGDHIAVHSKGQESNTTHVSALLGSSAVPSRMANDDAHVVRITYEPGELDVYFDNMEEPTLTVAVDLESTLRLDDGHAWVGFTASNEPGFHQAHDIINWFFLPGVPEE